MTTVTIDDALATRLLTVRGTEGDLDALVAEALAKTVRDWERKAQGRAEIEAKMRQKYGFPDLSHLTADELADQAEQTIAAMDPQVRAEAEREGWL